ncbi:MAG: glycosyltransferase [Lachnospiraceae bacterium]|nr:glycosyltransferase [Candidatus Merdinaster equi]
MKIAIAAFNIEKVKNNKYYNSQQEGLGKALAKLGFNVHVYHFVAEGESGSETVMNYEQQGVMVSSIVPCANQGVHAIPDNSVWDEDTDVLIAFSDKSTGFPKTYKYFSSKSTPVIPYVGVLKSHNPSSIKRFLSNLRGSNISYYKEIAANSKTPILSKTPGLASELLAKGISNTIVLPVGLDEELLKADYRACDKRDLRMSFYKKYVEDKGCAVNDITNAERNRDIDLTHAANKKQVFCDSTILLYIGRLTSEKQPLAMLGMLKTLIEHKDVPCAVEHETDGRDDENQCHRNYHLIMVGKGELQSEVDSFIMTNPEIATHITLLPSYPNSDIWSLYRLADCYINLNAQEIFGMSILEAMYYECPVYALHAPGPDSILSSVSHEYLFSSAEEMLPAVREMICRGSIHDVENDVECCGSGEAYNLKNQEALYDLKNGCRNAGDKNDESITQAAHEHIVKNYLWDNTALRIRDIVENVV